MCPICASVEGEYIEFIISNLFTDNSDLIACTVVLKDSTKYRRFLVIEALQLVLVEPDSKRLGWGSKLALFALSFSFFSQF